MADGSDQYVLTGALGFSRSAAPGPVSEDRDAAKSPWGRTSAIYTSGQSRRATHNKVDEAAEPPTTPWFGGVSQIRGAAAAAALIRRACR